MARVILARHGQTTSNIDRSLDTAAPGAALTDLGVEQAGQLAQRLSAEPIGSVFCSVLLRAQQTAAPVGKLLGLTPFVREGIREVQAGALEGSTEDAARLTYRDVAYGWMDGNRAATMPGLPMSGYEFLQGYDAVVAEALAAADGSTAVLVTHGTAMRVWTAARTAGVTPEFAREHIIANTGIIVLERDDGDEWQLLNWDGAILHPA